jgi:hypothetical protein
MCFDALISWRFFNCFNLRNCDLGGSVDDEGLLDLNFLLGKDDEDGEDCWGEILESLLWGKY